MRILAIDIGTGTQNNLPFDADQTVENSAQLVIPAPTVIALQRVQAATTASSPPLVLTDTNTRRGQLSLLPRITSSPAFQSIPRQLPQ